MREITLEELLEAGCHFGHQVTRQNPKAREFIFEARDNIHIIDLAKTKVGLDEAAEFVRSLAAKGGTLLIVGTKRQAQPIVLEEIQRADQELSGGSKDNGLALRSEATNGLFYALNRWIGGTLTNFGEVSKNYKKIKDLEEKLKNDEEKEKYTKREVGLWEKGKAKLLSFYGGTVNMQSIPDALFIIDTHLEDLAVKEALKMGMTTVGIVDTNADPLVINYPIPANDDAVGSLKLIITHIVDAWIEGRKEAEARSKNPIQQAQGRQEVRKEPETKETKGEKKKVAKASKEIKEKKPKAPKKA